MKEKMAISILPVGSTTKNKEWWVALNKGFVYDIMDSAMKKAGMFDATISPSMLEEEKCFEQYLNYDRYEPPRIYCVEDGVPLIYLSSYSYTEKQNSKIKEEHIESELDCVKISSKQFECENSSNDVKENKLDKTLSEKMHHLDIKVPLKDAEVLSTKFNLPHRPTPVKRKFVPNSCSLSFNYKVARNSTLDHFHGCEEVVEHMHNISNVNNTEINNLSSLDYRIHSRLSSPTCLNSSISLNRCMNTPSSYSPRSDCPCCTSNNHINASEDNVIEGSNKSDYVHKSKDLSQYELSVNDEPDHSNQCRIDQIDDAKNTHDSLRNMFRNAFRVSSTVKQCKGTTVYGCDGQIFKQFDGSICDNKTQSVISLNEAKSANDTDNDQSSPKLGWVAVSKEDVNHIFDAVVESMIKEEVDVNDNEKQSDTFTFELAKDDPTISCNDDKQCVDSKNLVDSLGATSSNDLSFIKTSNDSDVSMPKDQNINIDNCNTNNLNSGVISSAKIDKVFKWKSSMLERVNEQSALNTESDQDDILENTVPRRTKRSTTGNINK